MASPSFFAGFTTRFNTVIHEQISAEHNTGSVTRPQHGVHRALQAGIVSGQFRAPAPRTAGIHHSREKLADIPPSKWYRVDLRSPGHRLPLSGSLITTGSVARMPTSKPPSSCVPLLALPCATVGRRVDFGLRGQSEPQRHSKLV